MAHSMSNMSFSFTMTYYINQSINQHQESLWFLILHWYQWMNEKIHGFCPPHTPPVPEVNSVYGWLFRISFNDKKASVHWPLASIENRCQVWFEAPSTRNSMSCKNNEWRDNRVIRGVCCVCAYNLPSQNARVGQTDWHSEDTFTYAYAYARWVCGLHIPDSQMRRADDEAGRGHYWNISCSIASIFYGLRKFTCVCFLSYKVP